MANFDCPLIVTLNLELMTLSKSGVLDIQTNGGPRKAATFYRKDFSHGNILHYNFVQHFKSVAGRDRIYTVPASTIGLEVASLRSRLGHRGIPKSTMQDDGGDLEARASGIETDGLVCFSIVDTTPSAKHTVALPASAAPRLSVGIFFHFISRHLARRITSNALL